jgi:hypothetical protein
MRCKRKFGSLRSTIATCKGLQQVTQSATHFAEGGKTKMGTQAGRGKLGTKRGGALARRRLGGVSGWRWRGGALARRCRGGARGRGWHRREVLGGSTVGEVLGDCDCVEELEGGAVREDFGGCAFGEVLGAATERRSSRTAPSGRSSLGADEDEHGGSTVGGGDWVCRCRFYCWRRDRMSR